DLGRHDDTVGDIRIKFLQHLIHVIEVVGIAGGDQNPPFFGEAALFRGERLLQLQIDLFMEFQTMGGQLLLPDLFSVGAFGERKQDKKGDAEGGAPLSSDGFCEEIGDGKAEENEKNQSKSDGDFCAADLEI